MTTAYLALKLFEPDFEEVTMPFDQIVDAVRAESVDGGLVIHEAQLTYGKSGLHNNLDLDDGGRKSTICLCLWELTYCCARCRMTLEANAAA